MAGIPATREWVSSLISKSIRSITGGSGEKPPRELSELTDVVIASPESEQVLVYNAETQMWENKDPDKGTNVVANPEGEATTELNKIQIGNSIYEIPEGGSDVEANPIDPATEELQKIKIGNTVYSIPEGGGGSGGSIQFDNPIYGWLKDENNSKESAKLAEYDGIATGVIRQNSASNTYIIEIDPNGNEHEITACDLFTGSVYINSVTIPVKKGYKYYYNGNCELKFINIEGFTLYPFKANQSSDYISYDEETETIKFKEIGSGGSSTHKYSTEEQIVGEWIDGKPIYEKVINFENAIGYETPSTLVSKNENNIDSFIDWKYQMIHPNGIYRNTNHYWWGGNGFAVEANNDSLLLTRTSGEAFHDWYHKIIIQYTKTTD